ncbi:hypothetical protein [Micromonospora sp. NPDC047730]|uniref:hypothetical protein n=1 Tax=Micromonospora sp. NPDC047730 TaxID=3364253 RepID=UPI00370FA783
MPTETVVPIAATGSGGGRSDLIVARVEDPFMPGEPWQTPADVKVGPYVYVRVIAGVPAGTTSVAALNLGYSAIALGRVDLPANTGTVTQAMIVDLRRVANPRRERLVITVNPGQRYDLTATTFTGPWTNASGSVEVPPWAAKAIIRTSIGGVVVTSGVAWGQIRARLGTLTTQATRWDDTATGDGNRRFWRDADTLSVPSALRGTTQTVTLEANRAAGSTAGVYADTSSSLDFDIEFVEAPA